MVLLLKDIIIKINQYYIEPNNLKFIKRNFFIDKIKDTLNDFFPSLNKEDINVLEILTIFTVDFISFKYGFKEEDDYYLQWEQNNCGDIKGVILLLLPFIDDKDNSYLLKKITDLNHFIYSKSVNYIPKDILELNRDDILSTHFKYGNMGIGLLPFKPVKNSDILLDLYPDDQKKIYEVMLHNFLGLLQTIEIINGKSYINWINIQPLSLNNYDESTFFIGTFNYVINVIEPLPKNEIIYGIDLDYNGLWIGDFYNVLRIKYYEDAKKIKWLFFPYELSPINRKYLIHILDDLFDLGNIMNNYSNNYDDLDEHDQYKFNKILENVFETQMIIPINILK